MAVRVKVRLESRLGSSPGSALESTALVNTGYEAYVPDCSVPEAVARRLGLWPPPPQAEIRTIRGYTGSIDVHRVPGAVDIRVVTPDRARPVETVGILIAPHDDEIILSDALAELLELDLVHPKSGLWRYVGEPIERPSHPAERW